MNVGKLVRDIVGSVAPTVAGSLGGPLAGRVARDVSSVLLGRTDATPAELSEAVQNMTPEQADALRALEADYTRRLAIAAEDRANARQREIDTGDRTTAILAYVIVAAAIAFNFAPLLVEITETMETAYESGSTLFELMAVAVLGYYFGSSRGSKSKEKIVDKLTR